MTEVRGGGAPSVGRCSRGDHGARRGRDSFWGRGSGGDRGSHGGNGSRRARVSCCVGHDSPGESGAAAVLVVLWVVVLVVLAAAGLVLTSTLATRSRVAAAADLAALAGATAALEGLEEVCARAHQVAARNGTHLRDCQLDGSDVRVVVGAEAPAPVRWLLGRDGPDMQARAHAELVADERGPP